MKELTALFLVALVVVGSLVSVWVVKSSFEAKSYNRLTGGNASTWDAMWVELRVDGNR